MTSVRLPQQTSFAELGTPLHQVTFVVVDLETTGGSPADSRITEFGAVKIAGGEIVGEFQSLVDPGQPIPAGISALTGITNAMVAQRPPVEAVLPSFLEFCRGTALVAHNARFDTGFLNAGLERLSYPRLDNPVVCTAALARRLVADEVRNCKLATLAQFFRCTTVPVHRALADARATVEVFYGLLERAGTFGVLTLEDLLGFCRPGNAPLYSSRRRLADDLPSAPGVYAFRSASGEVLYVGKAADLRSRVRSYFGNDERRKIASMIKETDRIDHWVCGTKIEAAVREVRLIAEHRPRFNRRSKHPERQVYLRLTRERFPRLSIVKAPPKDGSPCLGPLSSRRVAEQVAEAIYEVVPIRRCTPRIGADTRFPPCALAAMGRCVSPCDRSVDADEYAATAATVARAFAGDVSHLTSALSRRMRHLSTAGRFEEAAATRDRLRALVGAVERTVRLAQFTAPAGVVASRAVTASTCEVIAAAHGRLVFAETVDGSQLSAAVVAARAALAPAASPPAASLPDTGQQFLPAAAEHAEELDVLSRWLAADVMLHHIDGTLCSPAAGGRDLATWATQLRRAHRSTGRPAAELAAKRRRRQVDTSEAAAS